MGNEVRIKTSIDDKVSTPLSQIEGKFESLGKKAGAAIGGGSAIGKGIGLAAGTAAFGLLSGAVSGAIGIMGDAVEAAREDEASQAKLGASLKANIPSWDGNTSAIESTLAARMRLGFSDDEQRDSLALLVAATHDSTKALELQRTAMDLARLKGISLGDASTALIKVEGGHYRALQALGIVLKEGATAQDALTAVQKVAAGQAEDYANTNEGKLLASQVKLSEAMETLGYTIMPAVTTAMVTASDIAVEASKHFGLLGDAAGLVGQGFGIVTAPIQLAAHAIGDLRGEADHAADKVQTDVEHMRGAISANFAVAGKSVTALGDKAHDTAGDFDKLTSSANAAARALAHDMYGPAELRAEMAKLNDSLATDKKHLHDLEKIKHPTAAQRADIIETKGRIAETKEKTLELRVQMALLDGTGLDGLIKELSGLARGTGHAADEARTLLALLNQVRAVTLKMPANAHIGGKAAGGPVSGGTTYLVGEKGPELFTPGTSGSITPNDALGGGGGASGAPVVIQLQVDGRVLAEIVDRQLYYAQARAPRTAAAS